jgi:8-oxo-dGTP diphosphatase
MELNGEYKLLERNLPSLCADRVDYALRDSYHIFGVDVRGCADSLAVMDNEIVFKSKEYARQFGEWFFECQNAWWRADENKLRYLLMADALSLAIKKGILTHEQLYGTDREVLDMLKNSKDKEVLRKLTIALGKLEFRVESDGAIELVTKMRYVDPKFIDGGKAVQLSDADGTYKNLIETELKKHSSNVRVNLIEKIYKPALVYIRDNKLLSVRSKGKDVFYIPGGKREFGETDEQALTREIKEELNVDVVQSSIKHMDTFEDHAHGRSKDTTVHISFYSADIIGEPSAGSEIEEVAWLDYSQHNKYPEEWLFLFDWLRDRGLLK